MVLLVLLRESNQSHLVGLWRRVTGSGGPSAAPQRLALQHCNTGLERDQRPGDALRSEPGRAFARPSLAPICHLKTGAAGYESRDPERFKRLSWTGKTLDTHLLAQQYLYEYQYEYQYQHLLWYWSLLKLK